MLILLMSTAIPQAASLRHAALCHSENLALQSTNVSLSESQSKKGKNHCHISPDGSEGENRGLKGTQKMKGKASPSSFCSCESSLPSQQIAAMDLSCCNNTYRQQGLAPSSVLTETATHAKSTLKRWQKGLPHVYMELLYAQA